MKRFSKLLVITLVLLFWNAGQIGSAENRKLKGKHVYSMHQAGISLQERIKLAEKKFSREFKSDFFLSGYTFEARSNSSIGGTAIDCQGASISRIIRRGDRLMVRTFGHAFEGKDKDCPEIWDRDLVFLHKKKGSGFEIVDVALLDREQAVEIQEIPFFWLGKLHTVESLKFLKKLFDKPSDRVKKNVLAAIAMHCHPEVADFLYGIARGNTRGLELRKNAIFWLGTVQDSASFSFLKKIAAGESENALRKQLIFAFWP